VPPVKVVPSKLAKPPVTVKDAPAPMTRMPVLLKVTEAAVAKLRPSWIVKLPLSALVVKLARASLLDRSTIWAAGPFSTMLAALVWMSAPANWSVPLMR
jgi:hypothetical protein